MIPRFQGIFHRKMEMFGNCGIVQVTGDNVCSMCLVDVTGDGNNQVCLMLYAHMYVFMNVPLMCSWWWALKTLICAYLTIPICFTKSAKMRFDLCEFMYSCINSGITQKYTCNA